MAALVEISKLNAQDRNNKTTVTLQDTMAIESLQSLREPSPKRLRTENDSCEDKINEFKYNYPIYYLSDRFNNNRFQIAD